MIGLLLLLSLQLFAQQSDSLRLKDLMLHYHQFGQDNKEPILLLTGGPGNSYVQLEQMALNLSKNYRVILPEQRGTGKSIPNPLDSTTVTLEKVTDDLPRLLENLAIEQATVIGHSWGGMLAMHFTAIYPEYVNKLILVSPGPHKEVKKGFEILGSNFNHSLSLGERERLELLVQLSKQQKADSAQLTEFNKMSRAPYAFIKPLPDSLFQKMSVERNNKTTELLVKEIVTGYDVSKTLKKYEGEIHIITGRQDLVNFCTYEIKLDIPSAELHWIEECGHFPMYEKPKEFYGELRNVLQNDKN